MLPVSHLTPFFLAKKTAMIFKNKKSAVPLHPILKNPSNLWI
jgi:hypothetical protein